MCGSRDRTPFGPGDLGDGPSGPTSHSYWTTRASAMDKKPFVCKDSLRPRSSIVLRGCVTRTPPPPPISRQKGDSPCPKFFCQKRRNPPRMAIARSSKPSAAVPSACTSDTTNKDGASPPPNIRSWFSGRRGRGKRRRSSSPTCSVPQEPSSPRRRSPMSSTPRSERAMRSVSAWFSTPHARSPGATACLRSAGHPFRAAPPGSARWRRPRRLWPREVPGSPPAHGPSNILTGRSGRRPCSRRFFMPPPSRRPTCGPSLLGWTAAWLCPPSRSSPDSRDGRPSWLATCSTGSPPPTNGS